VQVPTRHVVTLAFVCVALGCSDSARTERWSLRITKLDSPPAFDPRTSAAELDVEVSVDGPVSSNALHRVVAELRVTQGGGIPVRTLTAEASRRGAGSVTLSLPWDGSDATGQRLNSDAFVGLVAVRLETVPADEEIARLDPPSSPSLLECRVADRCVVLRSCSVADTNPERCELAFSQSEYLCGLLGAFVPPDYTSWNFSGTGALGPIKTPFATDENDRYPANAPAGKNPNNDENPVVVGTDLGSPLEHTRPDGTSELLFLFGDTKPLPESSYAHDENGDIYPSGSVFTQRSTNDDTMAISTQAASDPPTGSERCLDLQFFHGEPVLDPLQQISGEKLIEPVTVDGPLTADTAAQTLSGIDLGLLRVPGPGFSLDHRVFALVPATNDPSTVGVACDPNHVCQTGYVCLAGACYTGDCSKIDGSTPCFKQNGDATIATSPLGDPKFRSLTDAEREPGAFDVYRQRTDIIPLVAFHVADESNLYVWGRTRIMGHPDVPSNLYFWKHSFSPTTGLAAPEVWVGCEDDPKVCNSPIFSKSVKAMQPLYDEDRLIVNQTSIAYLPEYGRWVMIYGGRLPWLLIWPRYPVLTEARAIDAYSGVYLRTAPHPWGPWSEATTIYNPYWSNVTGYCEIMYRSQAEADMLGKRIGDDFLEQGCDLESKTQVDWSTHPLDFGVEYGTAIVPRFTEDHADEATLYWLMSTWHPYRVVVMKTRLTKTPD
jgi:hypothetical protein